MAEDLKLYLEEIKFEKYLAKLKKKLKNKKVVVYGAGSLFQYIKNNYDISSLNIIGISDMKFKLKDEINEFMGYKIIARENIANANPDVVLVATLEYLTLVEGFMLRDFKNTKTKVYPLARIPFWQMIVRIWNR